MSRWRPWIAHGAFSLILFLITAATYSSLGVVLPAMVRDLGWNWTQAGLGFTLMGAATGLSSWFPAVMIRRWGLRATLLAGSAVMAAGLLGFAHAESLAAYLVGAVLCGAGFQMMALIPGTYALGQLFTRKAMAFGTYFTLGALGGVAGPLMAEQLSAGGWRGYWGLQAVLALVVGVAAVLAVGRIQPAAETQGEAAAEGVAPAAGASFTVAQALRTPQFYVLLAAYFSHLLVASTAASLSVAHLTERGASPAIAGLALSLEGLLAVVARLVAGFVAEKVDSRWLLVIGQVLLATGSAALAHGEGTVSIWIYAAGVGVGFGFTVLAVTLLLLEFYGPRHNLEIFALTCLIGAVSATGPLLVGLSRDHLGGFGPGLHAMGMLVAVIALACAMLRRPRIAR